MIYYKLYATCMRDEGSQKISLRHADDPHPRGQNPKFCGMSIFFYPVIFHAENCSGVGNPCQKILVPKILRKLNKSGACGAERRRRRIIFKNCLFFGEF